MQTSPIFKGATRPPCVFGIPLKPFALVVGLGLFITNIFYWFVFVVLMLLIIMRQIAKYDDQRFEQLFLWLRVCLPCRRSGIFFAGPCRYRTSPSVRKHLFVKAHD